MPNPHSLQVDGVCRLANNTIIQYNLNLRIMID